MTEYERVLPRDLFNEAKLLKCLGFLTLHIHDSIIPKLTFSSTGSAFNIEQDEADGDLCVTNIEFHLNGYRVFFSSPYNSKSNFPLTYETLDGELGFVFNDDGTYTDEFQELIGEDVNGNLANHRNHAGRRETGPLPV